MEKGGAEVGNAQGLMSLTMLPEYHVGRQTAALLHEIESIERHAPFLTDSLILFFIISPSLSPVRNLNNTGLPCFLFLEGSGPTLC